MTALRTVGHSSGRRCALPQVLRAGLGAVPMRAGVRRYGPWREKWQSDIPVLIAASMQSEHACES
jgi:hypothetical protein